MSKDFWNQRYSNKDYSYGTTPNHFFKEQIDSMTAGKILLPADGEGRNSVYAAKCGWDVVAFDFSEEGRRKALNLASENNVEIDFHLTSVEEFEYDEEQFDAVAIIFNHYPLEVRESYFNKFLSLLKYGGTLFLEVFSKEQIGRTSGGPKDINNLYSEEELLFHFGELKDLNIKKLNIDLSEGQYHSGNASVIRLFGTK